MKNLFKANIVISICLLITACGQVSQATPSVVQPAIIATDTKIPFPTATQQPSATATIMPTLRPTYVLPTLIPTIDPLILPDLLQNAFSIQTLDLNGYQTTRIGSWELGYGGGFCDGFKWLDSDHLILYPRVGQDTWGEGGQVINMATQPIIINVATGHFWLPPSNKSGAPFDCYQLNWSSELKILITAESKGDTSTVSTFTFDGEKLSSYPGKLLDISPKGTKILLTDYKVVDLITNKKIDLNWNLVPYEYYWDFYWTSDETRIYRCCYFYADVVSGKNLQFAESDFLDSQGNPFEYTGLSMYRGQWVLNDSRFLAEWSYLEDGDIRYLPIFDPTQRILYDVREMTGISDEWTCYYSEVSPDNKYVWMAGGNGSYLIDLSTFKNHFYPGEDYYYIDWSPNSNFIWVDRPYQEEEAGKYNILSIADKEVRILPVSPLSESEHLWHPTDNVAVHPSNDKNALIFLDAETMSFQELPFKDQESQYKISNLAWNPNGDKLIFITDDHILWQVDYPTLENMEQLVASANTLGGAKWSPDGNSISFISGSDIYIVDTIK